MSDESQDWLLGVGANSTAKAYLVKHVIPVLGPALEELLAMAEESGHLDKFQRALNGDDDADSLADEEEDEEAGDEEEDEESKAADNFNPVKFLAEALRKRTSRLAAKGLTVEIYRDPDTPKPAGWSPRPKNFQRKRRQNVFSESLDADPNDGWQAPVYGKSAEQVERIERMLANSMLLANLEDEEKSTIVSAMFERTYSEGDIIINQGEEGDNFYILDEGTCECYVQIPGQEPKLVLTYTSGSSFGELALMYNAPRAASIKAVTACKCWALDRITFKRVLMMCHEQKRDVRYNFLDHVPLFDNLSRFEKLKLLEAIKVRSFSDEQVVILEGTPGTEFFIIDSGEAKCTRKNSRGQEEEVFRRLRSGDYFGEVALIRNQPRACTITSVGSTKLLVIDQGTFSRLLGPIEDVLKRNMDTYARWEKAFMPSGM